MTDSPARPHYHESVKKKPAIVGLISDTHGLLRQEAVEALRGSDLIIHAGDVGERSVFETLARVAPVAAVRGNVDTQGWAATLPAAAVVEAGNARIHVLHNIHELGLDPVAEGFHVVVSGHSHRPRRTERAGVLYINPGSAGPRRFHLPVTVARLNLGQTPWTVDFIDVLTGASYKALPRG